jgi:DNA-binding NarL/FixJ family response regulator
MTSDSDGQKRRIFIVDDHPLVREWLVMLINQQADLKVCGEAGKSLDALRLIPEAKPHLAVIDISMEGGSGIELIKSLKADSPEVAVIVLSMHDEASYGELALRAGARGYVMKLEATKNILRAIRTVLDGKFHVSEKIANIMAEKFVDGKSPAATSPVDLLSDRELEVFQLLGRGLRTRQIAEELHVSFKTVQAFCARIKPKLKVSNANELLREATRWHDAQNLK